jgi:hypothetical protein
MSGLDRVVASRLLTCVIDGRRQEVQVNLGEPYDGNGAVTCASEIVIGDHSTIHEIVGIDGIQALQLALFMVGSSLRSMSHASDWRWADEAGSGFPSTLKEPLFVNGTSDRRLGSIGEYAMAEMIPFRYDGFWDVPRFILLRYGGKVLSLQSHFDDDLGDYPDACSVY